MLHCISCGKSWYDILLGISKEGIPRAQSIPTVWGYLNHTYYKISGDIYECFANIIFCEKCSDNLTYNDIRLNIFHYPEYLYPHRKYTIEGYHCSKCGYDINF